MCDAESNGIGDLVPDHQIIYRACLRKSFFTPDKRAVGEAAFFKQGKNHTDGLSCALTPHQAVQPFNKNYGVIKISVGDIHALGRNLEVRYDTQTDGHVLIRNLPCSDRDPAEKNLADAVAAELALRATIESALPYPKE